MKKVLYIVVPCYNEEDMIKITTEELTKKLESLIKEKKISNKSKIMYINDGSKDNTWNLIKEINKNNKYVTGISLSRNRGHQNALLAGLIISKNNADIIISMDADLQDDIHAIDQMIDKYNNENCEIVYGVRNKRKTDTWFKRITAQNFYKFMKIMGVETIYNHADFRLTSKRVIEHLENYEEVNLFLRGIFPLIGFKSSIVYYERKERIKGESKYPLKKMIAFALDGITSFSIKPIRLILALGVLIFITSIIILLYCLIAKLTGNVVDGWTFIVGSIWLVAGIQMFSIGIVGEYIGKIYSETKKRPRYIIEENLEEK